MDCGKPIIPHNLCKYVADKHQTTIESLFWGLKVSVGYFWLDWFCGLHLSPEFYQKTTHICTILTIGHKKYFPVV